MAEVVVTGSRIRQNPLDQKDPVLTITAEDMRQSGFASLGDYLNQLSISGSALNTRFNSSGNFGFPPDGGGIGAGSTQVDLRHLGCKRVLVLVNGVRWVNGASASGVSSCVDLNTIPLGVIARIEVLENGASPLYGSDAISGVVNIITKTDMNGIDVSAYTGEFDEGDGTTQEYSVTMGSTNENSSSWISLNYFKQSRVNAPTRSLAQFPKPFAGGARHGSSGTPQGRFFLTDPNTGVFINCTTVPGSGTIIYDPLDPCGVNGLNPLQNFDPWDNGDRFNFAQFNLVVTPSERWNIFGQSTRQISPNVNATLMGSFTHRESTNQAAPEPWFIGSEAGNGNLMDTISIDVTNPFNPFGFTIDANDPAGYFIGRRPLEVGPRIFDQSVDTWYLSGRVDGEFTVGNGAHRAAHFEGFARGFGPRPSVSTLDEILANLGAKTIVIGHTKVKKVAPMFGKRRVLPIDIPWTDVDAVRGILVRGDRILRRRRTGAGIGTCLSPRRGAGVAVPGRRRRLLGPRDRPDGFVLGNDHLVELVLHGEEPLGLGLLQTRQGNARHLGDVLGHDFRVDDPVDLRGLVAPLL
ncbi:MAG: TonB-dependent receptor plug domain-containing protein, partial [Proteobacteria bacterium]|nr:TonB-dependent receptor plug domain-containing protein [Pseudomonadota bacterium]